MWEHEDNNSITAANAVESNQTGFGALETDYDHDLFRVYVAKPGFLQATCQSSSKSLIIHLLEGDGTFMEWGRLKEIDYEHNVYTYEVAMYIERPGNYYLEFADAVAPVDYNFYYCYRPYADKYVDVQPGRYYYVPVQWAVENHIANGVGYLTFDPHGICTRAHAVTFLNKAPVPGYG